MNCIFKKQPQPQKEAMEAMDKVSDDVRDNVRPRKLEWKDDKAQETIPKFSCVMTVEELCGNALRLADQFAGSDIMKKRAFKKVIPITALKAPEVDLTKLKT